MSMYRSLMFVLGMALAACGGGSTPAPVAPNAAPATVDDPACPVAVPGTSASVEDTDLGAALVFVTTGDVEQVRARARAMAKAHVDHHAAMGPMPTGLEPPDGAGAHDHHHMDHGGGAHASGGSGGGMITIHSNATAADIDSGARIEFVASPGDVPALRDQLRMHAQHLAAGTCAMEH
jgi:hypothetical protein